VYTHAGILGTRLWGNAILNGCHSVTLWQWCPTSFTRDRKKEGREKQKQAFWLWSWYYETTIHASP